MAQNPPEPGPETRPRSSKTEERLSGRARRKLEQEQASKRRTWLVAGGAAAAIAAVALLAFLFTRKPDVEPVAVAPAMEAGIAFAGRTMGDPDAPVTVVEWGDYQ
ncbi:MAG: hypothetical protein ACKOWF_10270 [Chloroflexota bacterium]